MVHDRRMRTGRASAGQDLQAGRCERARTTFLQPFTPRSGVPEDSLSDSVKREGRVRATDLPATVWSQYGVLESCGIFRVTRPASECRGRDTKRENIIMPEWLELVLFFVGYIVVMRWILPRFGMPT